MSAVSSVGVVPSGYLSSDDYNALSPTQQTVANAAQNQLNNTSSLIASLNGGLSAPASLFSAQTTYTSPGQAAAAAGTQTKQNSQLLLVSSLSGEGNSSGLIAQWATLQALTRGGGLGGLFANTSASDAAASGQAALLASQQALVNSVYTSANRGGSGAGGLLDFSA